MRRAFVADQDRAVARLAPGLAFHQDRDAGGQARDLGLLAGDGVGQVVDGADQVGEAFLVGDGIGHADRMTPHTARRKAFPGDPPFWCVAQSHVAG